MFSERMPLATVSLGSVDTSGTNETDRTPAASAITVALLQTHFMTEKVPPNEVFVPVGVIYDITTEIEDNDVDLILTKNGVAAATGGTVTIPLGVATTLRAFLPFSDWTFAAAPAAGDTWSMTVTVASTAGVVSLWLVYATKSVAGITDGVTL